MLRDPEPEGIAPHAGLELGEHAARRELERPRPADRHQGPKAEASVLLAGAGCLLSHVAQLDIARASWKTEGLSAVADRWSLDLDRFFVEQRHHETLVLSIATQIPVQSHLEGLADP